MQTTILGILLIISAICNAAIKFLNNENPDVEVTIAGIVGGLGLIKAADAKKPSNQSK